MHPVFLGQLAHDHLHSLIDEADAARLAHIAAAERPGLRRRVGLRLIAAGERLASDCTQTVARPRGV